MQFITFFFHIELASTKLAQVKYSKKMQDLDGRKQEDIRKRSFVKVSTATWTTFLSDLAALAKETVLPLTNRKWTDFNADFK